MVTIIQQDDPILRQHAAIVPLSDITSARIKKIIKDMKVAMHSQDDAVAIAAPQIAESVRIFVVSGKVFMPDYPDVKPNEPLLPDLVCINPVITKTSKKRKKMAEGCLSVRWLYGNVARAERATLEAFDETGQKFTRGASGLLAQIFQHEVDHLDGILFIDKAEDVENVPPPHHE